MTKATYDDADLILRLYDLRREPRMREARKWFIANFKVKTMAEFQKVCPPGSEENASYRQMATFWEMVASLLTSGVLQPELFYQSGRELLVVWERMRDFLPELRTSISNPLEYRNLELAASAYIEWWRAQAPGAYEALSKRLRG